MDSGIDGTPRATDSDGNPNVFNVERNEDGLWLNDNWAKPDNRWNPKNSFLFRLRPCFLSVISHVTVFLHGIPEALLPTPEHLPCFIELHGQLVALRM